MDTDVLEERAASILRIKKCSVRNWLGNIGMLQGGLSVHAFCSCWPRLGFILSRPLCGSGFDCNLTIQKEVANLKYVTEHVILY